MRKILAWVVGVILSVPALSSENATEKFGLYAELIHALNGGNTDSLSALETRLTKCGFGPGEEGTGCVKRILESHRTCKKEVVQALKQGCAMTGDNACVSPPQAASTDILYAGPRIHLDFAADGKSMTIASLICGGD